ncbi:MAG TPA: 4-alpha-glucanotransferase [Methanoregulaceae archaeon]|nr:4-alpha-glucanotransferase [Methanoregulaceae archaeon]HQJ87584.1 4-alpha-glucanotransferase [Methanoregulaceae archaeon]
MTGTGLFPPGHLPTGRSSGVLCHVTSLPSPFGCGDLGPDAYRFAGLLAEGGQAWWQVLPLNPTEPGLGNSPYASPSAFAGNTLLISPALLVADGYLDPADLHPLPPFPDGRVDFPAVTAHRAPLLERAAARLLASPPPAFDAFSDGAGWLDDHCLFVACRARCGGRPWYEWPRDLRLRHPDALLRVREEYAGVYDRERALQFLFFDQWERLRRHCAGLGIRLIGDLPFYVLHDSADLWAHPGLFRLDAEGRPLSVAGVPPDYFSADGQRWGNPVYEWEAHRREGYAWWLARFAHMARLFDAVRIDHFCGFAEYWEIPAEEPTARVGAWQPGPGFDLLARVRTALPGLALIAEDLGHVTPAVEALRDGLGIPGMRVLLFAFGPGMASSPHVPHNHDRASVLYLGTHDNPTAVGWFEEAPAEDRSRLARYLGRPLEAETVADALVRLCLQSVAGLAVVSLQDHLGLGAGARMNRPGTATGNWEWRCAPDDLSAGLAARLADLAATYGRTAPGDHPPPP